MNELITGNSWFGKPWRIFFQETISRHLRRHRLPVSLDTADTEPLTAFVNAGRWIVKCECGGAEEAWEEKLFFCFSCLNNGHGHKLRPVEFPEQRAEIEALLARRPLMNRNWNPGETVKDLKRENKEHKAELLPADEGGD